MKKKYLILISYSEKNINVMINISGRLGLIWIFYWGEKNINSNDYDGIYLKTRYKDIGGRNILNFLIIQQSILLKVFLLPQVKIGVNSNNKKIIHGLPQDIKKFQ